MSNKIIALAEALNIKEGAIEEATYGDGSYFEVDGGLEYVVYDEYERESAFVEAIDCLLPEVPEHVRNYFDDKKFINDCRYDGYGHTLSPHDGHELEEVVEGEWYYIYRTN